MYRLLIADDEELVRRGLGALLAREAPAAVVVGSACDGVDALELAQRTAPDIVITDIKMPGLSGLDLIERLHDALPDAHYIILSGYDEFAYARRAIALGVEEYLLKPVDPDELLALLARVQERIDAERRERQVRSTALRIAAEQSVRRLLGGLDLPDTEIQSFVPSLHAGAAWGLFLVQPPRMPAGGQERLVEPDHARVAVVCRHALPESIVVEDAHGYVCVLVRLESAATAPAAAIAGQLYQALDTAGMPTAVIAARPRAGMATIGAGYGEALDVAEYHQPYLAEGPVFCWEILPTGARADRWPVLPVAHRDALLDAIAHGVEADAVRAVRAFMAYVREHLTLGALRALWLELVVLVIHHAQGFGVRADALLDAGHNRRLLATGTVDAARLEDELVALATRAAREARLLQQSGAPRGAIAELRSYIEDHPAADLSINTLARRVHLNAKYLGEVFKAATGEPLGEFVIRVRMRHACELLAHSSLKVYAVAEQVGYGSPKHFATMFRSLIGASPAEYRAQRRGEEPSPLEPSPPAPLPCAGEGSRYEALSLQESSLPLLPASGTAPLLPAVEGGSEVRTSALTWPPLSPTPLGGEELGVRG